MLICVHLPATYLKESRKLYIACMCMSFVQPILFFLLRFSSLAYCYSEKNFVFTTFYKHLVRSPVRGIAPSKAHTCSGKNREKKRPMYLCDTSDILTLNSFFRANKDRQRFQSSDSHVAYISAFKNSPSILTL